MSTISFPLITRVRTHLQGRRAAAEQATAAEAADWLDTMRPSTEPFRRNPYDDPDPA